MGQYYKPIILKSDKKTPVMFAECYDVGSLAKLMEHSWMLNPFVGLVEKFLLGNKMPIVWAGDYADEEDFETVPLALKKKVLKDNSYYENSMDVLERNGVNLYTMVTYGKYPKLTHSEDIDEGKSKYDHNFNTLPLSKTKYLVNHDKKEFVNKDKVPKDSDGWRIHPLPLLTCEGNNRGGGDFRGEHHLIGSWARDCISIESKKSDIPKDFKEVIFNLVE